MSISILIILAVLFGPIGIGYAVGRFLDIWFGTPAWIDVLAGLLAAASLWYTTIKVEKIHAAWSTFVGWLLSKADERDA